LELPSHPQARSTGLANQSVVLYQNVKIKSEWKLQAVVDELPEFAKYPLYISWYEGTTKRWEPVGRDSGHALKMLNKKQAELAYRSLGGEIKERNGIVRFPDQDASEQDVSAAVKEYLADCKDREGQYGNHCGASATR
jgi:hypothetical protein